MVGDCACFLSEEVKGLLCESMSVCVCAHAHTRAGSISQLLPKGMELVGREGASRKHEADSWSKTVRKAYVC